MQTTKKDLTEEYQQVNQNESFFIQVMKGTAKFHVSDEPPENETDYFYLNTGEVLTHHIVTGTVWAKILPSVKNAILSVTE